MKEYYYMICDNGDGSCSVHWFRTLKSAQDARDSEDGWYYNEGRIHSVKAENLQPTWWAGE